MPTCLRCLALLLICVWVPELHAQNITLPLVTATCTYTPSDRETLLTGGWYNGPPVTCEQHHSILEGPLTPTEPPYVCIPLSGSPPNRMMQQTTITVYNNGRTGCIETISQVYDYTEITMDPTCTQIINGNTFGFVVFEQACC